MANFFRAYFVLSYMCWPVLLVLALREGAVEEEAYPKRYYWLLGLSFATLVSAVLFGWCLWAFPLFPLFSVLFFQAWWKVRRPLTAWEAVVIVLLPTFAGLSLLPYRNSPLDVYDQAIERRLVSKAQVIRHAIDRYASDSGGLYPAMIYGGNRADDPLVPLYLRAYPNNPYYGFYRSPWFVLHNFCVFDWGHLTDAKTGFSSFDTQCREKGMGITERMVNVRVVVAGDLHIPLPGVDDLPTPLSGNFEYIPEDFGDRNLARAYTLKVYGPYWKKGFVVYSSRAAAKARAAQEPDEDEGG
ncbi:MAG: hypothetical protein ACREJQ_07230 [bacterium]